MSYIDLKNIYFSYEDASVFEDYTLSIEKGEAVAIMGQNGSGKTTLFNILNGLLFIKGGEYIFDGTNITSKYLDDNGNSKRFHKRVGYLFQDPNVMLFNGNVYDEVAFGPRQMGLDENGVKERVEDMLSLFGIEDLRTRAPYHLSGGQKKKVAFASVLSLNPEVMILDEPLAGLDDATGQLLLGLLHDLKRAGKTIIFATHDKDFAKELADRTEGLNIWKT